MPPAVTARPQPTGLKIDLGHRCVFACALAPTLLIWEKSMTLPGWDGGDPIDTSTMWNTDWRTFISRVLRTLTDSTSKWAFTGASLIPIGALINQETSYTIWLPNGGAFAFWAYLQKVDGATLEVDGDQPEMSGTIKPTNMNPSTGAEEGPVYQPPGGSGYAP